MPGIEPLVHAALGAVVLALEAAAALIVVVAAARALVGFLAGFARDATRRDRPRQEERPHHDLRHRFGRALLLALDFTIGSDMLRVALTPTWEQVSVVGVVVLVRVVLTLVLEHELRRAETSGDPGA